MVIRLVLGTFLRDRSVSVPPTPFQRDLSFIRPWFGLLQLLFLIGRRGFGRWRWCSDAHEKGEERDGVHVWVV